MRIVKPEPFKVYQFSELSEEAQEKALEEFRDINIDYPWWGDDEFLLDPTDPELKELIPDEEQRQRYSDLVGENGPLFSWDTIYFNLDRGQNIDFFRLQVKNDEAFYILLGIPEKYHDDICYGFNSSNTYNPNIILDISPDYCTGDYPEELQDLCNEAVERFGNIARLAWERLCSDYYYRLSDEAIRETIEANKYEFKEDGTSYL